MVKKKKTVANFIKEVIAPIEENQVDNGRLFVLINSFPIFDSKDKIYKQFENVESDEWDISSEAKSSRWQEIESDENFKDKYYRLKTLSGLIWHGHKGGNLYEAEYEGPEEQLGLHDFFYFSPPTNDRQTMEIEAQEGIDNHINLGIKIKKSRIVSRIKNWTPFLLWSFSIQCAEHQFTKHRTDSPSSETYKDCLIFANAYAKIQRGMGAFQMEELIQMNSESRDFQNLVISKLNNLTTEIEQVVEKDWVNKYIGKSILACMEPPYTPFVAAREARARCATNFAVEYRDEYEFPALINARSVQEEKLIRRIWYALMKEELDWQVSLLSRMLGE